MSVVVANDASLAVTEEAFVVLILPLLARVLTVAFDVLACVLGGSNSLPVKVPHANNEVAEILVALEVFV